MTVLVTGGAGFIGSHLVDVLIERGHRVTVIDNLSTGSRKNVNRRATLVRADVADPKLAPKVARLKPAAVFHLAAQRSVSASMRDPLFDVRSNIFGTVNMLQAAKAAGSVRRFVYTSTGGALFNDEAPRPTAEDQPPRPLSYYGLSKYTGELYVDLYRSTTRMACVTLRAANVYGPRQDAGGEGGVVAILCTQALAGQPLTITGDGHQTRDFVYVGDVIRAHLAALRGPFGTYHIGTGHQCSILNLAETVARVMGANLPVTFLPARPGEVRRSALKSTLAQRRLNWRPLTTLEAGVRATLDSLRG